MATIKSYTDLEQSKKLAEILPLESADMHYPYDYVFDELESIPTITEEDDHFVLFPKDVRCWSLAALLGVLQESITKYIESERCQKTFHLNLFRSYYCCVSYDEISSVNDDNSLYCIGRDNWVDACYEMILKLHELKML